MSSPLPEQYQRYAQPDPMTRPAVVELHDEADPIVHVPDPYDPNRSVAVRRSSLQPVALTQPRDLTPQPVLDPLAQRMLGGGVGAGVAGAGVGWGIGQAAAGIASIGGTAAAVMALLLWLLARGGRGTVNIRQEVHNHASWWGSNTTKL